jgi:hypothetical protein
MSITDIAAWYAAAVATVVLGWDIVKWFRAEPRLRVTARCNVCYADSAVVEKKQLEGGQEVEMLADYCHVEVVNIGGRPTTLIQIEATNKLRPGGFQVFATSPAFVTHAGNERLPARLGPGEMWSARLDMRQLDSIRRHGLPVIRVRASYKAKPVEVMVSNARPVDDDRTDCSRFLR